MSGWIGVDLDGTLAVYGGWKGPGHIGEPVEKMAARVRAWLASGREVRIFTARASSPDQIPPVQDWTERHFGVRLPVTNVKDFAMVELWDDRAVSVIANTGEVRGEVSGNLHTSPIPVTVTASAPDFQFGSAVKHAQADEPTALRNLLAVIHGDGGHHTAAVGIARSSDDALKIVHALRARLAAAETAAKERGEALRVLRNSAPVKMAWTSRHARDVRDWIDDGMRPGELPELPEWAREGRSDG